MAQPAPGFSSRRVTVGNATNGWLGTPDLGKGFWHLFRVREASAVRGVWLVAGTLAPTLFLLCQARLSVSEVWTCGFSLPQGRVPVGSGGGGIGWRLDVGSLFSLSLVLVSIL